MGGPARPIVILTLALLLAGCAAPALTPAATTDAAPDAGLRALAFEPATDVAREPNGQAESFIAVSPDGRTLLTCLHGEFKEPSPMFASVDGGASWTRLHAPGMLVGGDCEVALMQDGTWVFLSSTVAGASVATTSDEGKSWRVSHLAALPTNGMADRPWIEAAGDALVLAYMPLFVQPGSIAVTTSTDKGATWSTPVHVTRPTPEHPNVVHGHVLVSPDGQTLRVPLLKYRWGPASGGPGLLAFAVSRDAGATWTEEPVLAPKDAILTSPVSVAATDDGTLLWAYVAANGTTADVRVLVSRDDGATWSEPRTVLGGWPRDAVVFGIGTPVGIPWMDGGAGGAATLVFAADASVIEEDAEGTRLLAARLHPDAPGLLQGVAVLEESDGYEFAQVEHDADGRAHVAFTARGTLRYVREA